MGRPYVKWFVQFILASVLMILVAVFLTGSGNMDEMFIRFMLRGTVAGCIGIILGDVSLYKGSRFILTAVPVTLFFCGIAILAGTFVGYYLNIIIPYSRTMSYAIFAVCWVGFIIPPLIIYNALTRAMRKSRGAVDRRQKSGDRRQGSRERRPESRERRGETKDRREKLMGVSGLVLIFIGVAFIVPTVWDLSVGMRLVMILFFGGGISMVVLSYKLTATFHWLGDRLNMRVPIGSISALLGNIYVIYLSVPLFSVERGASVRAMGAAGFSFITWVLMLVVSLPLVNLVDKRISGRWEIIGKVLCFFPFVYTIVGWHIIAMIQGFSFSP